MPEGPSIVILKEAVADFKGKHIVSATGTAKIDMSRLEHLKIKALKSWGKHFLICFDGFFLRIHLLMFGTYKINERKEKDKKPRLSLSFKNGEELNFYTCSIVLIEQDEEDVYDWERDIMSDAWNGRKAEKDLKKLGSANVCDVLLNQELFSGVGNIIKNEVLFRTRIHPLSMIDGLPPKKLKELIKEARNYSLDFYTWKKAFTLKEHWLIYTKKECPRCELPVFKEYMGKGKRLTFFCQNCQLVYDEG